MQKFIVVVCALLVVAIGATAAVSAEDLAAAVKKRRDLMKKTVAPAAKLGGQMIKGVVPFDGTKAAKAMNTKRRPRRRATSCPARPSSFR